ncbi:MAG: EamA family transporter, partial [Calditrichia bacterium]|nr:EamA family transporter [Calditrichia bacterium]
MRDAHKIHQLKIIFAFTVIYFVWGSTYIAIRFAIETIPPFLMAGIRFTVSGLLLYMWQNRNHSVKPRLPEIRKSMLVGLLLIVGGNGTLTWSEQYIPSSLAALILTMIPVWMVWLDSIFVTKKRPPTITIIGILLGVLGVALLSGVDRSVLLDKARPDSSVFFYAFMLVCAGLSWSSGSLYSRTVKSAASLLTLVSIQMLAGGLVLLILGSILGEWSQLSLQDISLLSFISLAYLIFFGSIMTYSAYNWLLRQTSPAKVGTYAFFNPLVAVFLGWLLVSEPVTTRMLVGAISILSAVVLV